MKHTLQLTVLIIFITISINAQLTAPSAESVYGGRIKAIDAIVHSGTTTRVFISTESANSIFYADVTTSGTPSFGTFTVMPGAGDDDVAEPNTACSLAAHRLPLVPESELVLD